MTFGPPPFALDHPSSEDGLDPSHFGRPQAVLVDFVVVMVVVVVVVVFLMLF
jgi:hypothetical protein